MIIEQPLTNDWIHTVNENLAHLDINIEESAKKSEIKFKKELKQKIQLAALKYLQNISIQKEHSKMDKLIYKKLSMQPYLYSNIFKKIESQNLFKLRTRMAMFANNFKNGATSIECPMCKKSNSVDSEAHSLICDEIIKVIPEAKEIYLNDIYSDDIHKMKETLNILIKILKLREDHLSTKQN